MSASVAGYGHSSRGHNLKVRATRVALYQARLLRERLGLLWMVHSRAISCWERSKRAVHT